MAPTTLFSKRIGKCMEMARRPEFWPFARYHALLFPHAPQIALPCCRPISSARPLSTLASPPPPHPLLQPNFAGEAVVHPRIGPYLAAAQSHR